MACPWKDRLRARLPLIGLIGILAGISGCVEAASVEFSIRALEAENPLIGASSLALGLERAGVFLSETEAIYAPDAPYFELPRVPLGEDYRFRVGIYDGTILLARARSFSFSVDELGIDGSPDLFVAPLGVFAERQLRFPGTPRIAIRSPMGLIAVLDDGSVAHVRVNEDEPLDVILPAGAALEAWPIGERLVIRIGEDRLALLGRSGIVDILQDRRLRHHLSAQSIFDEDGGELYLIGGSRGSRRISRLVIGDEGFLDIASVSPLSSARQGSRAFLLRALDGSKHAVVIGGLDEEGAFRDDLLLLDFRGGQHRTLTPPEGCSFYGAAVIPGAYLQLLVIGGRAGDAVRADVQLLVLNPRDEPRLELVSPSPASLHIARERADSLHWSSGLYLIYGGNDAEGNYIRRAEIVDLRQIPGSTAPTGLLPKELEPTIALILGDGSIFMSDGERSAGYTPPRAYD